MLPKIFMILLIAAGFSQAGITVNGTVKNAVGEIPVYAHAHIAFLGESVYKPLKTVEVDKNGQFQFDLENRKYYSVYITAVNHIGQTIPLLTDGKDIDINMSVQLKSIEYADDYDEVKIIGDWNKFKFSSANGMLKQKDGTFVFDVKSEEKQVAYQILNIDKNGHSVNGTQNDGYKYDGGGDYRSLVNTNNGAAKIVFNPKKLLRSSNKNLPVVNFKDNNAMSHILEINQRTSSVMDGYYSARQAYIDKNKTEKGFKFDFSETSQYLKKQMQSKDDLVRRFAAAKFVRIAEDEDAKKIVNILPVTDPLWTLNSFELPEIYTKAYGKEKAFKMIHTQFDKIPSESVQSAILVKEGMEAKEQNNTEKMARIYKQLKEDYGDQSDLRWYLNQLDPNKKIAKGKAVPDFEVQLINSNEVLSKESMLGKYYVMDFWAVWCGPCRAEMPNLHEAYKEFKSDRFTILSLSFDPKVEAVHKYRKETWPMPWLHTFVEKGFNNELSKRFEVMGIPKPILVNPEGVIIATDSELRGENLKKTLNKFLNTAM